MMALKTLLLLRHAKSSWKYPDLSDHDRPLNKRGKRDAPRMGDLLRDEDIVPDLIISSSAKRALDTAEAVADSSGYASEIVTTRLLYHADVDDYHEVLKSIENNPKIVMIVSHNPGLEELLATLTGEYMWLPTAALAKIEFPFDSWSEMENDAEGELVNLWLPRELN
jgi:phosphohistidine phosphatase